MMTLPAPVTPRESHTIFEDFHAAGHQLVDVVEAALRQGNARRVIVRHDGRTLLELPLTMGVIGTLLAPQLAALGALAALVTECAITVERELPEPPGPFGADLPGD